MSSRSLGRNFHRLWAAAAVSNLGHHDPGFTLRTYAHLMPESEDRARAAIDAALDAPAESSRNAERG